MTREERTARSSTESSLIGHKPTSKYGRLLTCREVCARTGMSRGGVYTAMRRNEFPKSITLSDIGRSVRWLENELNTWITLRVERSRAPDAQTRTRRAGPGRGHRGRMYQRTSVEPTPDQNRLEVEVKRTRGRPPKEPEPTLS